MGWQLTPTYYISIHTLQGGEALHASQTGIHHRFHRCLYRTNHFFNLQQRLFHEVESGTSLHTPAVQPLND